MPRYSEVLSSVTLNVIANVTEEAKGDSGFEKYCSLLKQIHVCLTFISIAHAENVFILEKCGGIFCLVRPLTQKWKSMITDISFAM